MLAQELMLETEESEFLRIARVVGADVSLQVFGVRR
jgi:hypothetical protein